MDDTAEEKLDLKACDIEVCRICMATDVKMHSLKDTHLGFCMESIGGFTVSIHNISNKPFFCGVLGKSSNNASRSGCSERQCQTSTD